jgi:hypothetical protein
MGPPLKPTKDRISSGWTLRLHPGQGHVAMALTVTRQGGICTTALLGAVRCRVPRRLKESRPCGRSTAPLRRAAGARACERRGARSPRSPAGLRRCVGRRVPARLRQSADLDSGGMAIPPPVPKLSVYEGQSLPDRRLDGVGGRFRFAAEQQPYPSAATRDAHDHLSALQGGTGAPLARQRGGRPRWRDTRAESTGASTRRRSCGRGGVDARGPRRGRRRPAGQGRCSGGWRRTRPQTEPAESEERDPRQDPPATNRRPYVTFAGSPGAPLA